MGVELGNKKLCIVSLHPTGPPLVEDVKKEDDVVAKSSESGAELGYASNNSYKELQVAISISVWCTMFSFKL